ncbi:hypothetical protein VPH35_028959 [Triticum aestivum]
MVNILMNVKEGVLCDTSNVFFVMYIREIHRTFLLAVSIEDIYALIIEHTKLCLLFGACRGWLPVHLITLFSAVLFCHSSYFQNLIKAPCLVSLECVVSCLIFAQIRSFCYFSSPSSFYSF